MNDSFQWVSCDGNSPHLLLPKELVPLWHGIEPESDMEPIRAMLPGSCAPVDFSTHYELACAVNNYIGLIPVATGVGLVLDDIIPVSTWMPSRRFTGGYLIVPITVPMQFDGYRAAVEALPDSAFRPTGLSITCREAGFLLFPAVDSPPDWTYPRAEVPCPPGEYVISGAEITTEELSILVHRLELKVA